MSKTQCITPIMHKKKNERSYEAFPCGKCPACRSRKASEWSFRLMQEEKNAHSAYFITLTYRNETLPRTKNDHLEICRRDLQLFFKRLRKMQTSKRYCKRANVAYIKQPLKYYAVGEYGGRFKRPHYHVIMFNASAELIERAWTAGHVHYGYVAGASVGYTMKYISKPWKPANVNDDRTPPFALMSKGLGESYLTRNMINYHLTQLSTRCVVVTSTGVTIGMPRYYRDKIYTKDDKKVIAYFLRQEKLKVDAKKTYEDLFNENETKVYKMKKINYDKELKKNMVETPLQRNGISVALQKKFAAITNNSRSGNVSKNSTGKIHKRTTVAIC